MLQRDQHYVKLIFNRKIKLILILQPMIDIVSIKCFVRSRWGILLWIRIKKYGPLVRDALGYNSTDTNYLLTGLLVMERMLWDVMEIH